MRWGLAFAVTATLLAGCFGSAGSPGATAGLGNFDAETGDIAGLVVDDSLQPVPNASVVLDGQASTTSGPAGDFSFRFVAPGMHQVSASSEGYLETTVDLEVVAGQGTQVTLTLVPRAIADAYVETRIQAGTILCVVGFRAASANTSSVTVCTAGNLVTNTSSIETPFLDWKVGSLYGDLVGFWGETLWKSTQALGKGMRVRWFVENRPLQSGQSIGADYQQGDLLAGEGNSPLGFRIPIELARSVKNVRPQSGEGKVICSEDKPEFECWLLSGHFASAQALPTGNVNVGVTLQQRYDDYLSLFHKGELPVSFSALPDT